MAYYAVRSIYNERDVREVIPESADLIININAPELKNNNSYWQIANSSVSRVKINALAKNVEICSDNATIIIGTASENNELIETIGTCVIHVSNNFIIEAHVTRSKDAPLVTDGILGRDFMNNGNWEIDRQSLTLGRPDIPDSKIPALPGMSYISDYIPKLRDRYRKISLARQNGDWSVVSKRLVEIRPYLPPEVSRDDRSSVIDVLDNYADCFYLHGDKIQATKLCKYPIKTKGKLLIYLRQPKYSQNRWDQIEILLSDLLRQGIIKDSTSPYNFPIGLMEKKPDFRGNIYHRIAVDFTELNNCSKSENMTIPTIVNVADELYGSQYFSVLDLASASYHIALEPEDRQKTAFTARSGRYEFLRMPVGIKNSASYIQSTMSKIFEDMRKNVFVCTDDILVHSKTIVEHEIIIRKLLSRVRDNGLKLQPGKCQLFHKRVIYLGHLITNEGLLPDPVKIEKLKTQKRPETTEDLRSYLGLLSTHKRFIAEYAGKTKPMWDLLKAEKLKWSVETIEIFKDIQSSLSDDLMLRYPNWKAPFIIKTGSSKNGIFAGLLQNTSGNSRTRSITWASRTYTPAESRLDISQQECLASVYGMDTFCRYLKNTSPLEEVTQKLTIKAEKLTIKAEKLTIKE